MTALYYGKIYLHLEFRVVESNDRKLGLVTLIFSNSWDFPFFKFE